MWLILVLLQLSKFLETWLNDRSGPWTIVRLGPSSMGDWDGRKPRWVGWDNEIYSESMYYIEVQGADVITVSLPEHSLRLHLLLT